MTNTHQRGIAIWPILFIVAILAVLASAIAAGSGAFIGDTSAIKAKAQATAILEYAESVKMGVDKVMGHGCSETEISFENPIVSGYENPNAPSDKSCHVFDVNGGGIIMKTPDMNALDKTWLTVSKPPEAGRLGTYIFMTACGSHLGQGGGPAFGYNATGWPCYYGGTYTDSSDLFLILAWMNKDVCLEINKLVGMNILNDMGWVYFYVWKNTSKFIGSYNSPNGGMVRAYNGNEGSVQGCLNGATYDPNDSERGGYYYFRALIIR